MISGAHCGLWESNHFTGSRLLAQVFVLNEHLPPERFFPLTATPSGLYIRGRHCGWQWTDPHDQQRVEDYLRTIQRSHEPILIEVGTPEPDLPGYPYYDYHPDDYPIVFIDE